MSNVLRLYLDPDNPSNTNLVDTEDGQIMYQVVTEHSDSLKHTITRVRNVLGDTIASWEWRDVRSDLLTIGRAAPMPVSAWLRKSVVPFKDTVYFHDHQGRAFKWKGNGPGMSLELYMDSDKKRPIAKFQKATRTFDTSTTPPTQRWTASCLLIDRRGEEIRDLVVISFLILEKARRAHESSTMNRAESVGRSGVVVS